MFAADKQSANASEFTFIPFWVKLIERFGSHQSQHSVSQELKALIVSGFRGVTLAIVGEPRAERLLMRRLLIGQGAMRQCADQHVGARKAMPQCSFQLR
jgi:hypothetical protein